VVGWRVDVNPILPCQSERNHFRYCREEAQTLIISTEPIRDKW
jgi:hypothetical protein